MWSDKNEREIEVKGSKSLVGLIYGRFSVVKWKSEEEKQ
jgi:hypothetical protein